MSTKRVALFAVSGAVAIATLEVCARIDDAIREGAPFLSPYSINALFQPSPFGREGKPRAKFGKWSMNSLGYRGPEPQPDAINILTFGASETFGLYEDFEEEYPRVLERALNSSGSASHFNVINIALPGVRIGRTGYLVDAIKKTNAKVVIIYPSPSNYIGQSEPLCGRSTVPVAASFSPWDHLRILGKLDTLVKKHLPVPVFTAIRKLSIWRDTLGRPPLSRVQDSTIAAFTFDLECAANAVQANGAKAILINHATYFGTTFNPADAAMMTAWRRFYPDLTEAGFMDLEYRSNAEIKTVADRVGARLIDARQIVPGGPSYFADFVHFTNEGASRLARALSIEVTNIVDQ